MLTVKEILDNATSSLRPVSDTGYPHTLQESLQLYTDYCCGGGEVVTPLPVEPYIWFDFTDTATIAETAGAVGLITDKISNYQATQGVTPARPLLVPNGVQFDGVDDYLAVAISVANPWTVLVKLERIAGGSDILLSGSYNNFIMYLYNGDIISRNSGIDIINPQPVSLLWTYSLRASNTTTVAEMNDSTVTNNAFNNATLNINDIARYAPFLTSYSFSCVLQHIMIFDKFLTDTELANMEVFLNA